MDEQLDTLSLCRDDVLLVVLDERCVESAIRRAGQSAAAAGANLHILAAYFSGYSWLNPAAELAGFVGVGDPETLVRGRIARCVAGAEVSARWAWHPDWRTFSEALIAILEEGGCGQVLVATRCRSWHARRRTQRVVEMAFRSCSVRVLSPEELVASEGARAGPETLSSYRDQT